jgi:hypothetical protein
MEVSVHFHVGHGVGSAQKSILGWGWGWDGVGSNSLGGNQTHVMQFFKP